MAVPPAWLFHLPLREDLVVINLTALAAGAHRIPQHISTTAAPLLLSSATMSSDNKPSQPIPTKLFISYAVWPKGEPRFVSYGVWVRHEATAVAAQTDESLHLVCLWPIGEPRFVSYGSGEKPPP